MLLLPFPPGLAGIGRIRNAADAGLVDEDPATQGGMVLVTQDGRFHKAGDRSLLRFVPRELPAADIRFLRFREEREPHTDIVLFGTVQGMVE